MIKTAIIGASGFIGSHLIKKYKSKYPDCIGTSFSSDVTNLLKFDLRNPNIKPLDLEQTGHKAVIITSFKANIPYCENEPRKAYEVNVEGILKLIGNFPFFDFISIPILVNGFIILSIGLLDKLLSPLIFTLNS